MSSSFERVRRRGGEFIIDTWRLPRFVPLVKGELALVSALQNSHYYA